MSAARPMSMLDEIESGLVVLDKDFQAQFINRAFYQMWGLPNLSDGGTYNFADIEHRRHLCPFEADLCAGERSPDLSQGQ